MPPETDHDKLVRIDVETRNQTALLKKIDSKLDKVVENHNKLNVRVVGLENAVRVAKWVVSPIIALAGLAWSIFHKGP